MKLLLDTNVIVDIAFERQPFYDDSDRIFSFIEAGQLEGYVSASTFSDLYYIIRKQRGRAWTLSFLDRLASVCQVATVDRDVISMALSANFRDFEDAIQYSVARVNQLDAIVTRDRSDFPVTSPQIITPTELIQELTNSL
ncbi:PIN domain-containing protein [Phormidium sp. LEGE 05292]|uniref:type II toxin-antitoxin system VapC family toxin n=1 Tax=[Phormidium] sp. LEGE 05292 TaxID=767427 RepID=UPI0018803A62|nr:PIN domain-containing protein [Phormidium sp. LEGE 05292]MBE9226925.1 PIN domain-containing protein [Phormidium sp. LEGE 05292]